MCVCAQGVTRNNMGPPPCSRARHSPGPPRNRHGGVGAYQATYQATYQDTRSPAPADTALVRELRWALEVKKREDQDLRRSLDNLSRENSQLRADNRRLTEDVRYLESEVLTRDGLHTLCNVAPANIQPQKKWLGTGFSSDVLSGFCPPSL